IVSNFFFTSRRRHTRSKRDWSSDVCSSDLESRQTYLYSSKNQSNDINDKVLEDLKTIIGYFNISINKLKNDKLLDEVIIEELINYRSNMTHIISNLENNLLVLVTLTKEK